VLAARSSRADENNAEMKASGCGALTSRCGPMGQAWWQSGSGGDALVLRQSFAGVAPADSDVQMRSSLST
jgi:hypothetical protein